MNEKDTLVEMTGNIVKEAWENGRREALKEIADKEAYIEKLKAENQAMRYEVEQWVSRLMEMESVVEEIKGYLQKAQNEVEAVEKDLEYNRMFYGAK